MTTQLLQGDSIEKLQEIPAGMARCCVTSPPYFGLRDYGCEGQIGLESTPDAYVARLVDVFRAVRRVLAADGTLWLNLGDSYGAGTRNGQVPQSMDRGSGRDVVPSVGRANGFSKQLLGIPWRVAFALQADGWILRSDIIWSKPNPMPESVRDRPTKSHEYLFLLAKQERYYYDADAVREPIKSQSIDRMKCGRRVHPRGWHTEAVPISGGVTELEGYNPLGRNKRSVWTVSTRPYKGAHFAVFPPKLIEPCILAGSAEGDTVLDPFCGSGTTGAVAIEQGRNFVGIDLNPKYLALARRRLACAWHKTPLFSTVR